MIAQVKIFIFWNIYRLESCISKKMDVTVLRVRELASLRYFKIADIAPNVIFIVP